MFVKAGSAANLGLRVSAGERSEDETVVLPNFSIPESMDRATLPLLIIII